MAIVNKFNIDKSFLETVRVSQSDILLCIMTLLHDSTFTFFDGTVARVFLCAYKDPDLVKGMTGNLAQYNYWEEGVLALYITYTAFDKSNSHPLFVSDLKLSEYCLQENLLSLISRAGLIEELPWTTAARIDRKLKLVVTA